MFFFIFGFKISHRQRGKERAKSSEGRRKGSPEKPLRLQYAAVPGFGCSLFGVVERRKPQNRSDLCLNENVTKIRGQPAEGGRVSVFGQCGCSFADNGDVILTRLRQKAVHENRLKKINGIAFFSRFLAAFLPLPRRYLAVTLPLLRRLDGIGVKTAPIF